MKTVPQKSQGLSLCGRKASFEESLERGVGKGRIWLSWHQDVWPCHIEASEMLARGVDLSAGQYNLDMNALRQWPQASPAAACRIFAPPRIQEKRRVDVHPVYIYPLYHISTASSYFYWYRKRDLNSQALAGGGF